MDEKNKVRLKYYECNMTKGQHMLAYLFFSVMIGVVLFIYYQKVLQHYWLRSSYNREYSFEWTK